jgi:hypothetical protein
MSFAITLHETGWSFISKRTRKSVPTFLPRKS